MGYLDTLLGPVNGESDRVAHDVRHRSGAEILRARSSPEAGKSVGDFIDPATRWLHLGAHSRCRSRGDLKCPIP